MEYSYDGKFEGSILVVGRTACGKTTFVQNLGKSSLFGNISEVYWIWKITLSDEREDAIRDSLSNQEEHFDYPANVEDFNHLIENFMQKKSEYVNSDMGRTWWLIDWLLWTTFLVLLTNLKVSLLF